jgi:hypothetical protein
MHGTTHLRDLKPRRQQRPLSSWLGGLPSSLFVCVVIVRVIVRMFVYARVFVLSNRFLIALPRGFWTPPSVSLTAPIRRPH